MVNTIEQWRIDELRYRDQRRARDALCPPTVPPSLEETPIRDLPVSITQHLTDDEINNPDFTVCAVSSAYGQTTLPEERVSPQGASMVDNPPEMRVSSQGGTETHQTPVTNPVSTSAIFTNEAPPFLSVHRVSDQAKPNFIQTMSQIVKEAM